MSKTWPVRLILAGLCLVPLPTLADPYGPSWKPEFGVDSGITVGGGNLLVSQVTGQPDLTPPTSSLYAGNTFFYQGYYRQAIGHTGLSIKASGGLVFGCEVPVCLDVLIEAFGGSSVDQYGFAGLSGEAALEYAWAGGRVGVGRTARYFNDLYSMSSAYPFQDAYLKPAYGWFLEYEYDHLGLRYTHIIYRSNSGYSLNGSNVGIYAHWNYRDEDWYPGGRYYAQGEAITREGLALLLHPRQWSS